MPLIFGACNSHGPLFPLAAPPLTRPWHAQVGLGWGWSRSYCCSASAAATLSAPSLAPRASFPCCPVLSGDWMERCRKLLAKRNTGARLDVCLDAVAASVDGAVEQFERRLDVSKSVHCSLWLLHDGALAGGAWFS